MAKIVPLSPYTAPIESIRQCAADALKHSMTADDVEVHNHLMDIQRSSVAIQDVLQSRTPVTAGNLVAQPPYTPEDQPA